MNWSAITLEDVIVFGYSLVGTLFLFYCFVVFLQREINNKIRLSLTILFLCIGIFFFNSAGRILTGYSDGFTLLTLISALMLAAVGCVCVYIIHRENRNQEKSKQLKRK